LVEMVGRGRPGIRIALTLCVRDDKPGSITQQLMEAMEKQIRP